MKASDALVKLLEKETEFVFGVPGGHIIHFYDSLFKSKKIKTILTKHEQGASFMAEGYAKVSGKLGVCTGTAGPGAFNLISGVSEANIGGASVMAVTGLTAEQTFGRGSLQEVTGLIGTPNQVDLFAVITKKSKLITKENFCEDLVDLIRISKTPKLGAVNASIPHNVSTADVNFFESDTNPKTTQLNESYLKKFKELLSNASKPVCLIGYGTKVARAEKSLRKFLENNSIPFATSLKAKGVIHETHPLSLGVMGLYGQETANEYVKNSDLIISVGLSFHERTMHYWSKRFQKKLIQVEIADYHLSNNYPADLEIKSDALVFAKAVENLEIKKFADEKELKDFKEKQEYFVEKEFDKTERVNPIYLMYELNKALPDECVIFVDIGNSNCFTEKYLQIKEGQECFTPSSLASMGSAVAGSVGAKLGTKKPVVCICGDGAFLMNGQEVLTAVEFNIPVIWIIQNNGTLGMINQLQKNVFEARYLSTQFRDTNFANIAKEYGAEGERITSLKGFKEKLQNAVKSNKPWVFDIAIDSEQQPDKKYVNEAYLEFFKKIDISPKK
ncbi:MAG: thiamine pyrophosphate-binding protein [archaeon]